ncbi:MAG: hypothetical protein ACI83W_000448 [Marinoscillum sp.]|jgi:hypothetical protein
MLKNRLYAIIYFLLFASLVQAQRYGNSKDVIEVGESMETYIKENHLEDIEEIIHSFTESRMFLKYLIEKGHHMNSDSIRLKRRDIRIGTDIDVYVKHFTEHQNFTMFMVPVDIYPLIIYDTLLFSVLEVSDEWLKEKYYYHDLTNDSVKSNLLAIENHDIITKHMYDQVMADRRQGSAEVEVKLHESYISTNSVHLKTQELTSAEKAEILRDWGMFKKLLSHNVDLNVEMNIYIFGHDDMSVIHYQEDKEVSYRITPGNIFRRHHFDEAK